MAKHVLVAIDGSEPSWAALDHAISQYAGHTITVLHAVDPMEGEYADDDGDYYTPEAQERAKEAGKELCGQARERAEAAGVLDSTDIEIAVETGQPAPTIVSYADSHDVDQIVVGSRGRSGLSRLLLGSVAETVTRRASVPVTIVR
ncbi:universal stress protein [Halomontanus rarus]|uniref:universal stress protein n=1 Tax=Halomontanus rarus TaxID=3034020 RepID=UPI001A98FBAF